MIKKNIKIIKIPGFNDFRLACFNELLLPPLGIAVICKYLRERGYNIEQDDLNIKIKEEQSHKQGPLYKANLIRCFCLENKSLIFEYLKGKKIKKIDHILKYLFSKIDISNVEVLLLSCYPTDPVSSLLSLCIACKTKKINKNILIIIGGEHHAQQLGPGRNTFIKDNLELIFSFGIIDFYIRGAGEENICQLLNSIGEDRDMLDIRGLIYRNKEGKIVNNRLAYPCIRVPDFDGLPLESYIWKPNEALLEMINESCGIQENKILVLPFQFMVGCPNKCAFCECSNPDLKLDVQEPEEAVRILKYLSGEYCTKYFFFLNSCLNISKDYINELCDRIIDSKLDISWSDCARVDNLDRQTLLKMRKAGAIRLIFGLETASERMLKYIGKHITLNEVEDVLKWCYEADIWCGLELISGFPHETENDILSVIEFLKRNCKYIDDVFSNIFYLEPNSIMRYYPAKYGLDNVRKMPENQRISTHPTFTLAFDEIGGLRWEEKLKQQSNAYFRIKETLCALGIDHPDYLEETHLLMYLYSRYSKKEFVRNIYRRYFSKMNLKRRHDMIFYAFSHPFYTLSRLSNMNSLRELFFSLSKV